MWATDREEKGVTEYFGRDHMSTAARITKQPQATPLTDMIPPFPVRRFTVEEYHGMLESGVLTSREPYELIHGWIVPKMGINPPHNYAVNTLMEQFGLLARASGNCTVRVQQPITTTDSEPEPDVVLAAGSKADYKVKNPGPAEVHIVIEVADSSLRLDKTTMLQLYAGAKVAVYWIVNLNERRVEVYTQPRGGKSPTYKQQTNYGVDDEVSVMVAGKEIGRIPVKELLP